MYHLYVIRSQDRDRLKQQLNESGISTAIHYPLPIHHQVAYKDLGYRLGDFPMAEAYAREILSLPMYPELKKEQVEYICQVIKDFK